MAVDLLSLAVFPILCPGCQKNFHKSIIDLVASDTVACNSCGLSVKVADYYGMPDLKKFLEENGYQNFILPK